MGSTAPDGTPRGGCLTAFLVLAAIGNALQGLGSIIGASGQSGDRLLYYLDAIASVVALVFVVAIWQWKKWGVYGFASLMGLALLMRLFTMNILGVCAALVWLILTIALMRPVMQQQS